MKGNIYFNVFYVWLYHMRLLLKIVTIKLMGFLNRSNSKIHINEIVNTSLHNAWITLLKFEKYPEIFSRIESVRSRVNKKTYKLKWVINVDGAKFEWEDHIKKFEKKYQIKYVLSEGDFDKYDRTIKLLKAGDKTRLIQTIKMRFSLGYLDSILAPVLKEKLEAFHKKNILEFKSYLETGINKV